MEKFEVIEPQKQKDSLVSEVIVSEIKKILRRDILNVYEPTRENLLDLLLKIVEMESK